MRRRTGRARLLVAGILLASSAAATPQDPTVEFTSVASSGGEAGGPLVATLQLSATSASDVTVPFTVSGDAADPADYSLDTTSPVTIPAGQLSVDLTITPADDALDENDESVQLTLDAPTGATLGTNTVHTATLEDDDDAPEVEFSAAAQGGAEDAGTLTVDVLLSAASGLEVSVPFTLDGSAAETDDYSLSANPLVLPAGQTSATLTLTVVDDTTDEDDETAVVSMGAPDNASLGTTVVHTATLTDDDEPPSVQFGQAGQSVGENGGAIPVSVTLSAVSGKQVSVPFSASGTAVDPDDYSVDASPLLVPAGTLTVELTVTPVDDSLDEADETVLLTLGPPTNASLGAQTVHTLILNDEDDPPTVEFQSATSVVDEYAGSATITLELSALSGQDVSVPFTLAGTADDPQDYGFDASPAVIPAGQATLDLTLTVVDDSLDEDDETVLVTLGTPSGAYLGAITQHTATLSDDDAPPTIEFDLATQDSGEASGTASVIVILSEPSGLDVSVPFGVAGTASDPEDFTVDASPLVISAGDTGGEVQITIASDELYEGDETVELDLGTPTNAVLGGVTTHTHGLLDDDTPPTVDFASAGQAAGEGAGSVLVTVVLSVPSGLDASVPFSAGGTASNPEDYTVDASPLVIPAGQTSADIVVSPTDDVIFEPAETVELTLGTPLDGILGSTTVHTLTLTSDDPPPTVEFVQPAQSSSEGAGTVTVDLTLSGVSGTDVVVPLLLSGSATDGTDFTLDIDTVVISAGHLTGSTTVSAIPDALDEADETVVLTLDTPSGADLGTTTVHTLTLVDDDAPPEVSFQVHLQTAGEAAGSLQATLVLSAPSGLDVTVPFTHQGSAEAGSDYTISGSPQIIPAGQTSADVVVTLIDDAEDEFSEHIRVLMDKASLVNGTPGDFVVHRIQVEDDDGLGTGLDVLGLRPDVTSLQFGQLEVGQGAGPLPVVVTNTQKFSVEFTGVALEGFHPEDYQVTHGQAMPVVLGPGQSASFDVSVIAGDKGPRDAVAVLQQLPHGAPEGQVDLLMVAMGPAGDEVRMNVGADEYVDHLLLFWSADFAATGDSGFFFTGQPIAGTDDDALYQECRLGTSFGYSFVLPDGEYDVVLHFAEIQFSALGQRVMDVGLEGSTVVKNLDLYAAVGAMTAWNTGPLRTTVGGGSLEVDLTGKVGEALLSAIEVRSVPLVDPDQGELDFGVVDQGDLGQKTLLLTNSGLADGKATQLAFVLDGAGNGTGDDFYVRIGSTDYHGGVSTVYHSIDLDLPAGQATPVQVFFEPTQHEENALRLEFLGDFETLSLDLRGTGGADADWGFLHPVLEYGPSLLVDYDEDGSEEVELHGSQSHTHEPGQAIVVFEWSEGGVPFSSLADVTRTLPLGGTTVELTITDDKPEPDQASDDLTLTLHQPSSVPGILVSYYDGGGDPVFLLDNLPSKPDHVERSASLLTVAQNGLVGGSHFDGDVLVRWEARFSVEAVAQYDFLVLGGLDHRIEVDGAPWAAPAALAVGEHDLELRFAVGSLADLPLQLEVMIDGQQASGFATTLVHDVRPVLPLIHEMPTVGTELGGNLITIQGFGFFPKDQVSVHWGTTDFTLPDFLTWTDEVIEFHSPAGTGSIQVTVETPNGLSDPRTFNYSPDGPIPIKFDLLDDKQIYISNPTSATWHPNGQLYVGTLNGFVYEVEFDEDWTATSVTLHQGVSGLTNSDLLGIAVNPYDPPSPVKLYVAHGEHFLNGGGSFQGESPFTGQITVLTGPDFDDPVPLITQLPTSNHDHGVNGLLFDDNGDLLICMGGNTNAGVKWPLMGDLPGSPFSGAILKARTSRPDFNGAIQYVARSNGAPVSDQVLGRDIDPDGTAHVGVHAAGFRNSYDLLLTTRGLIYATDNGPNVNYGPASTGPDTSSGKHPQHDDELNLVEPGGYYGHANRNRGEHDARQFIWRDITEPSDVEFTQALHTIGSSTCGLEEYRAQTFNGQLRGRLVAQKWNSNQRLVELAPDGRSVVGELILNPLATGLDVIAAPGGALITVDYTGDRLRFLEPDDASAVGLTIHDVHPWRTTAAGVTPFVIGGEGFVPGQTAVKVGGLPAALTSVTARRIAGVFPPLAENNIGALYEVEVTVGLDRVVLPSAVLCLPIAPGEMKGFWTSASSMPDALGEVACAVLGTSMYAFGEGTGKTYAYDVLSDTWSDTLAPRPFAGNHHACEVVGGQVYLIGGLGAGSQGRVQIYDPASDSWSSGANMPWAGGSCSSGVVGGLIYVCGGIVGSTTVSNLSVYDPVLDEWDQGGALDLAPMSTEVNHAASASDGSRLWVFGGRQGGNFPQPGFDTVQSYDPATDIWDCSDLVQSSLEPMPKGRGGTGRAVWYAGEFYVFGGESTSAVFGDVQVYRPASNSWRDETVMPTPRHGVFPTLYQNRMFLAGGGTNAGFSQSDVVAVFQRP